MELFGDTPRALTVSKNRKQVFAAVFHSGNQTSVVTEGSVCDGFNTQNACFVRGVQMPGGAPGPSTNFASIPAPEVGLIVKYDEAAGRWEDELGRNWNNAVRFDLPDKDVFSFDADALTVNQEYAHVGTILFNMVTNPVNGKIYVSNSDARNEVRFEGPGTFVTNTNAKPGGEPSTVQGHLHEMRITVLDGTQVLTRHLNKHIDY